MITHQHFMFVTIIAFRPILDNKNCRNIVEKPKKSCESCRKIVEKFIKKMASLSAVILPAKALKGGKHKVRISVAHNGETRYLLTDIVIDSEREFKNGVIVRRTDASLLNTKLRGLLNKYQKAIDELEYQNCLNCSELVYHIKNGKDTHITLYTAYKEYMDYINIKPSSQRYYEFLWKGISANINECKLLEQLTTTDLIAFLKALRKKGLQNTTIKNYMAFLSALIKYAVRRGHVQYKVDPFLGVEIPKAEIREAWLSVEQIKKIRDLKSKKKNINRFRDIFMLSYYLGGINCIDLLKINFNEQTHTLHYIRTKTERKYKINKYVEFEIPDEAKEIIQRIKLPNGYLTEVSLESFQGSLRFNLSNIAKLTGIRDLIYYSARKSFSQHAYNLGIGEKVIDYILGHNIGKGSSCLYHYIYVTPEMATDAIRKVLDNLK